jgi:hypothetical protein
MSMNAGVDAMSVPLMMLTIPKNKPQSKKNEPEKQCLLELQLFQNPH